MTLERAPLSFANAISTIAEQIGYPAMAATVRRSERLVRKWSHPDAMAYPTVDQAIALDAAYIRAGGDYPPLSDTLHQLLDQAVSAQTGSRAGLVAAAAAAARESGQAIAAVMTAALAQNCTASQREAEREVEEALTAMAVVGRRLSSFNLSGEEAQ